MSEPKTTKRRTVWRHRLRSSENVHVTVVTRRGKPFVEVIVNAAFPTDAEATAKIIQERNSHGVAGALRLAEAPEMLAGERRIGEWPA